MMKKMMKEIFRIIGYFLFLLVLTVIESVKYIATGKSILGKLAIIAGYFGLIITAIFTPVMFVILLGIVLVGELVFTLTFIKSGYSSMDSKEQQNDRDDEEYSKHYHNNEIDQDCFFVGLTMEEAKKEYRRLMKQYHPDNEGGSLEITQRVATAYDHYKAMYAR